MRHGASGREHAGKVGNGRPRIGHVLQHGPGKDQIIAPGNADGGHVPHDGLVEGARRSLLQLGGGDVQAGNPQAVALLHGRRDRRFLAAAHVEHPHAGPDEAGKNPVPKIDSAVGSAARHQPGNQRAFPAGDPTVQVYETAERCWHEVEWSGINQIIRWMLSMPGSDDEHNGTG